MRGREAILKVSARGVKMDETVDYNEIARLPAAPAERIWPILSMKLL